MATFDSLYETRVPKSIKAITLIGNMVRYEHTETEAEKLLEALEEPMNILRGIFAEKWGWDNTDAPSQPTTTQNDNWSNSKNKPAYVNIHDMAANAPLADLTTAMAVYLNRIDEEIHERKQNE